MGIREVFKGVVFKEQVAMPDERIDFSQCNEAIVEYVESLYIMCWNERYKVLHNT